jgi:hypothetical protein
MWAIVQLKNPIWYIDATGGIINKIPGQKKPFLYSVVVHDTEKRLIFPISEFISTANDAKSIASYFADIKLEFLKKIPRNGLFQVAPIVVTDFSWGLINAVLETFNNCTATIYINWCFEIIFKESDSILLANIMKCIFQLCSVHFLKLIITKVRKIKPFADEEKNKKIQNDFIFAFTLLQNSINIEEFTVNFINVYNIFNLKYASTDYDDSTKIIKQQLLDRNLTVIKYNEIQNNSDVRELKKKNSETHQIMIVDDDFSERALKNYSPFAIHFNKCIKQHEVLITKNLKDKNKSQINWNYCPKLFNILLDYIHILPFWTVIMVEKWKFMNPNYSKLIASLLNNNPVENHFKQTKHCLFEALPVMPSQYTSRMKLRLDALCIENYKNELDKVQLNNAKHSSDATEPWQNRKNKRRKGSKTFYDDPNPRIFEQKDKIIKKSIITKF